MTDKDSFEETQNMNQSESQLFELNSEEMDREFMEKMLVKQVRAETEERRAYREWRISRWYKQRRKKLKTRL